MPSWCSYGAEEVEALVVKLAKEGNPPDIIGQILRDQYGIPLVKAVTGKKIIQMLKEVNLAPPIPEDLNSLLRKAKNMARHLGKNKGDRRNIHNMQLLEARIHRLSAYYKRKGKLSPDWKYKPAVGFFI